MPERFFFFWSSRPMAIQVYWLLEVRFDNMVFAGHGSPEMWSLDVEKCGGTLFVIDNEIHAKRWLSSFKFRSKGSPMYSSCVSLLLTTARRLSSGYDYKAVSRSLRKKRSQEGRLMRPTIRLVATAVLVLRIYSYQPWKASTCPTAFQVPDMVMQECCPRHDRPLHELISGLCPCSQMSQHVQGSCDRHH